MNQEKTGLRKNVLAQIEEFPDTYIDESNAGIYEKLISLPEFINAKTIFTYYSIGRESDTRKIIDYALSQQKVVTLPVCFKGGIMEARAISDPSELSQSSYGLYEPFASTRIIPPEQLDFVIVPALAYDREGFRLGYGGGYYDRFLKELSAFTVGVGRERLFADVLPREKHDIPVKCIVTEKTVRLLGEPRV